MISDFFPLERSGARNSPSIMIEINCESIRYSERMKRAMEEFIFIIPYKTGTAIFALPLRLYTLRHGIKTPKVDWRNYNPFSHFSQCVGGLDCFIFLWGHKTILLCWTRNFKLLSAIPSRCYSSILFTAGNRLSRLTQVSRSRLLITLPTVIIVTWIFWHFLSDVK